MDPLPHPYESHHPRYRDLVDGGARLTKIATGMRWAEGPVWFVEAGFLIWSDIPNDRMLRWSPAAGTSVFRAPSAFANGNTRDTVSPLQPSVLP